MRRLLVTLGFAAMMLGGQWAPARADVVYAINPDGSQFDLSIASVTDGSIMTNTSITGLPAGTTLFDSLAFNPVNQMLYGMVSIGTTANLVEINPATAASTTIGLINGGSGSFGGMAFDSAGDLFSIESQHPSIPPTHPPTIIPAAIVQIDISSMNAGSMISSQALSTNSVAGITLAGSNIPGTFYVLGTSLETIDQTTGLVTPGPGVGSSPPSAVERLSFYGTTLYGVATNPAIPNQPGFGPIDPTTGVFSSVSNGTYPGEPFAVGASVSVPEPSSIVLLVGGALGLGLWRWKTAGAAKRLAS
jgi:hypothetical protein